MKVFSGNKRKDDEVLSALLKNQSDQTRILDKLTLLYEHQERRTEDLHRFTHDKLDEVTDNQNKIHETMLRIGADLAGRKSA